jgi:hypothetical protein
MAFGEASFSPTPQSKANANVTSSKRVHFDDTTTTKPALFDEAWVWKQLTNLNKATEPILDNDDLEDICLDVLVQLDDLTRKPVAEVWAQAATVFAEALTLAKLPATGRGVEMGTPLLGQFLVAINGFITAKNEKSLADYLVLEPPFGDHYVRMIQELKRDYAKGREEELEERCGQYLKAAKEGADGATWTPFIKFMVQYLGYLRDVDANPNKYLETYNLLSELQSRANSALTHGTLGYLMLPIVVSNAKLVCRLAIGLDKQPQIIAHLKSQQPGGEDGGPRETLPERAANIIRTAFTTCLNDRTPLTRGSKPEGRKRGIYIIANICLKIFFQCRKTRNATQIFENIYNLSPPLSSYPKRERVTYLYYLGRFYFQNSHFYRAQLALQQAYDESPARQECVRQRRHILVYLIASNIILGRFPSQSLLNRPEARGLAERFLPICMAIRKGDLASFRRHLDFNGEHADWFLHFRILLQLKNRCEVLVWRSLVRKAWILNGTRPDLSDPHVKAPPTVNIRDLMTLFTYLETRASSTTSDYTDPDFQGIDYHEEHDGQLYDLTALESILSSLIDQGLLGGFFSHKAQKFAITGARMKGSILAAGFPRPWEVLKARAEEGEVGDEVEVPGWKKDGLGGHAGLQAGPGMVFNLSGARPVGAVG